MKYIKELCAIVTLAASLAYAAPYTTVRFESQNPGEDKNLEASQLGTTAIRAYSYSEGTINTLTTNDTGIFGYGTNWDLSASMVLVEGAANTNGNYFDITLASSNLPANGTYYWQMLQTNSQNSSLYVLGKGTLDVMRSPITGGATVLSLQQIVNWDGVVTFGAPWVSTNDTSYLNGLTNGALVEGSTNGLVISGRTFTLTIKTNEVTSVAGRQGDVVIVSADLADLEATISANASVAANTAKATYPVADSNKVAGIEALADVTDTDNVRAAGALMDDEVDADLKTFVLPADTTISAYGKTLVDDADAATARTTLGVIIGTTVQGWSAILDGMTSIFTVAMSNKLAGIEASADVTDADNVIAAGAFMKDGSIPATGNWDLDGYSIIGIGTNSLTFSNGDKISIVGTNLWFIRSGSKSNQLDGASDIEMSAANENISANASLITTHHTENVADIGRNANNILANGFRIAVNGSLTAFDYEDGWLDEFEDQSGVATALGSNFTYDAASDYYSYAAQVSVTFPTGILAHYKMNDDAANVYVTDETAGHPGGLNGGDDTADLSVAGKLNEALHMDGANDWVDLTNNFSGVKSMVFWAYNDTELGAAETARGLIGCGHGQYPFLLFGNFSGGLADEFLSIGVSDGTHWWNQTDIGGNIAVGWHHYAIVWDGVSTYRLYIDNVDKGLAREDSAPSEAATWNAARYGVANTFEWDGPLDQGIIYNNSLSAADVALLWNGGDGTESITGTEGAGGNMELISTNAFVSISGNPVEARVMVLHENITGVAVLNTDLKAFASSDQGTNWNQITLTDIGELSAGISMYAGTNALTGSSSNMAVRVTTHNTNQAGRVHGWSELWK